MAIFDLEGKISLDSAPLMRGLKDSESSMKGFSQKISNEFDRIKKVAAAVFTGAVIKKGIDAIKSLADETSAFGDAIDKQSQQLGMSRKAYQEWDYILSQSGASIESMGFTMRTLGEAYNSTDADIKLAFSDLHLSTENLKRMKPEEAFETVVRAFQEIPPSAEKSRLAIKIFGRSGQQLMPLLNSSSTSIDEFRAAMEQLGLYMSDDAVDASVAYGDALDTLKRTFNSIKFSIGSKILPVLTNAFEKITSYAGKIKTAYEKDGLKGVFDTLVSDIKNIKWPSWDDVATSAGEAWETIKKGVAEFGGLVFGKTEDGKVNWPDLGTAITWAKTNLWYNGVVAAVKAFGGLIFGKNEEGKVNWPSFKNALAYAKNVLWDHGVKAFVATLGGLVFGKKEDGEVNWPDVSTLKTSASTFWQNTALPALKGLFSFTKDVFDFTLDTLGLPDIDTIVNQVNEWWNGENGVVARIKGKITSLIPKDFLDTVVEESLDMTLGSIANKENSALGLLDKLISMGDASKLTAEQQAAWKATAQELINLFPQLSEVIDIDKQSISGNTAEIRENIKAWSDLARERAIADAKEKKQQLLVERNNDLIETQIKLEREQKKLYEAREGMIDRYNKVLEKYGMNERIDPNKDFGEQFNAIIDKYSQAGDEYETFWQEFGGANSEVAKVTAEILKLQNEVEANKEKLQAAEAEYAEWEAALNSLFEQVSTNSEGAKTQVDGVTSSLKNVPKRTDAYIYIHTIGNIPSIGGDVPSFQSKKGNVTYTPFAKGLWEVPYNDYPALLHEGEMVLTKTQAQDYKEGKTGQSLNVSALVNGIIGAIQEGMRGAQVTAYMDGKRVTRETNKIMANELKNVRFVR